MKLKSSLGWFRVGVVLVFAAGGPIHSAEVPGTARNTGALSGRVQNAATGDYLEGAIVTLESTSFSAQTARDGSFYFSTVPPGEYRLTVTYTGLDSQTAVVPVAPGQSVTREVALTSKIYALDPFTVAGEREGNALAITQQRNANNMKNVI